MRQAGHVHDGNTSTFTDFCFSLDARDLPHFEHGGYKQVWHRYSEMLTLYDKRLGWPSATFRASGSLAMVASPLLCPMKLLHLSSKRTQWQVLLALVARVHGSCAFDWITSHTLCEAQCIRSAPFSNPIGVECLKRQVLHASGTAQSH